MFHIYTDSAEVEQSETGMLKTRQTGDKQIRTNPGKFGWNRTNWAKWVKIGKHGQKGQKKAFLGKNRTKSGKKKAKSDKKLANKSEPWGNRAKPKVSPNLGSVLRIPGQKPFWDQARLSSLVNKRFAGGQHPFLDGSCLCHQFFESKASQIFFCKCLNKLKSILLGKEQRKKKRKVFKNKSTNHRH